MVSQPWPNARTHERKNELAEQRKKENVKQIAKEEREEIWARGKLPPRGEREWKELRPENGRYSIMA